MQNNVELPEAVIRTIEDLKSTCLILLDKLNDQNVAIDHQKQTNKWVYILIYQKCIEEVSFGKRNANILHHFTLVF